MLGLARIVAVVLALVLGGAKASAQQTQCISTAVAGGTVDALTIPILPCSVTSTLVVVTASGANVTSAPTMAMPPQTAPQTIVKFGNQALAPGDISGAGAKILLTYDGQHWTLLNPAFNGSNGATVVSAPTTFGTATVGISNGTPAVISWTGHGLSAGSVVNFTTTGNLPTGLVPGVNYYVISPGLTANSFEVSATAFGNAINTSSAGSGVHTGIASAILVSGNSQNIAAVQLGVGKWDVSATVCTNAAASTVPTKITAGVSSASAALPSASSPLFVSVSTTFATGSTICYAVGLDRVNVGSSTILYLVNNSTFTVSTASGGGSLLARQSQF